MKLERPVRHLLVDLDGTLLNNRNVALSFDFVKYAFATLRGRLGFTATARALLAVQDQFKKNSKDLTNDIRALQVLAHSIGTPIEETRQFVREALLGFFPKLERHFYPAEGAREFLEWAAGRFGPDSMVLATNPVWPPEVIEMRVRWAGLDPASFGMITHAKNMHACKPTTEYYEEILQLRGWAAEDCLLVGNEHKMDLPASRAGIAVFIVDHGKGLAPLRLSGGRAQAFEGTFQDLRRLLEGAQ